MLEDILKDQQSLFADGSQTVLRGQENRVRSVSLVNGSAAGNDRSESRGVSARVYRNGSYGFSSSSQYTRQAVQQVLREAEENARILSSKAPRKTPPVPAQAKTLVPLNKVIEDAGQKQILEVCQEVDSYIVRKYPDLLSRKVIYEEDSQDKIIYTSDASCGHVTSPRCYLYVFLDSVTKDGLPVEVFKAYGGSGCFADQFGTVDWLFPLIDQQYQLLADKREGVYTQAGYKTVILGGIMGGMLAHEAVGHTLEADLVVGGSVAGPNLHKKVASDLVSLVDFASQAFGKTAPLPVYLDDEGTPARDAVLIQDGILTGYMNNRETAQIYGMQPTGSARAWTYHDEPIIRMRNTFVLPGKSKLEDMIASIDDGYYLIDSLNGQADLTGEFMFSVATGYEIKHGKLGKALLDTTVSGVAFDLLKTVDMVSDHVTVSSSGFCGKKQPMAVSMGGPEIRCKIKIGGR